MARPNTPPIVFVIKLRNWSSSWNIGIQRPTYMYVYMEWQCAPTSANRKCCYYTKIECEAGSASKGIATRTRKLRLDCYLFTLSCSLYDSEARILGLFPPHDIDSRCFRSEHIDFIQIQLHFPLHRRRNKIILLI
jgi:hypothetical protein